MLKRRHYALRDTAFTICVLAFIAGAIAGAVVSAAAEPDAALADELLNPVYLGYWDNLWSASRYFLVSIAAALTLFGIIGAPAVCAIRGFFLCFTVAVIVRVFGASGIGLAAALALPETIIAAPCLMIISSASFGLSKDLIFAASGRGGAIPMLKTTVHSITLSAAAAFATAALKTFVGPIIVNYALKGLT